MRVSSISNTKITTNQGTKNTPFRSKLQISTPNKTTSQYISLAKSLWKLAKSSLKYLGLLTTIVLPSYLITLKRLHQEYPQIKPIQKVFDTQESALNYSISRITAQLNSEYPREYSININNQKHRIISEAMGNDSTVSNYTPLKQLYNTITTANYNYTSMHGHPAEKDGSTTSFSFKDFKNFIAKDNCNITYVVNKDGKFCKMIKTENYKKPTEEEIKALEDKFDFYFNAAWPHTKTIYNNKGEIIFKITDYPGLHDYWDFTTKKFGIQYYTTFGTYGLLNDIYKDGYHQGFYEKEEKLEN